MAEQMRMIVIIVDRGKGEEVAQFGRDSNIDYVFLTYGRGTLRGELINLLGLGTVDKDVITCVMPHKDVKTHFAGLSGLLKLKQPGKGIAFSIPLSALNALVAQDIENAFKNDENEAKEVKRMAPKFSLIIVVAETGYVDTIMEVARGAGATGGTIMHARGVGREETESLMGTALHTEKEIVAIIAERTAHKDIMTAINDKCGLTSDAKGIVFSLPVDELAGIG